MATQSLSAFQFQANHQVRVFVIDGDPWFVAADVCAVLEHSNPTMAVKRLDDDEKQVLDLSALNNNEGGNINSLGTIINESGLYSLILTSRKPEAKKFKKWVTSEVLPAIRKTGRYVASEPAHRYEAAELFGPKDQNNLTRLVWLAQNPFRYGKAVNAAIHMRLRAVTGVPAPQKYRVSDIPVIAAELRLIFGITRAVSDLIVMAEGMMVRRILRRGENADKVLLEIRELLAKANDEQLTEASGVLASWHEREVADLIARKPNVFEGYPDAQESLRFV